MPNIVKLGDFYVEVSERPIVVSSTLPNAAGVGHPQQFNPVGGITVVADKFADARDTIAAVCRYVQAGFVGADRPDELTVRFGIKLGGEAGIPYVTKGTGEATIELEATWKNGAPE